MSREVVLATHPSNPTPPDPAAKFSILAFIAIGLKGITYQHGAFTGVGKEEVRVGSANNKTGTCLCGSVSVSVKLEKCAFDACHCGMCRKWGGGPALTV